MKRQNKKLELLAPAGNLEKMKTALAFGADAIYAGTPDFSLRTRINDFDLDKIKEAALYCHKHGKKIYATVNIFAHNRHLKTLPGYIKKLKNTKVDALIVSDPGVLEIIKKIWPDCEIHLSTQANCTNWRAAEFWYNYGVKRIILGREVNLDEIKEIHKKCPEVELEYFVHGAMCVAYSGRCFLSKHYKGRSGNLGNCAQPCRWFYTQTTANLKTASRGFYEEMEIVEEKHGSYILNAKDLCLIKYLRELAKVGVDSFKIEGRAKSVYYQAMIAGIYSRAIDNLANLTKKEAGYLYNEMETKLTHRGYTTGFLLNEKGGENTLESHITCKWEFCGQVEYNANNTNCTRVPQIANSANRIFVRVHNSIKLGDEIEIIKPFYDIIKTRVEKLVDAVSGDKISAAHGGQGRVVILEINKNVPEYSVLRRRVV